MDFDKWKKENISKGESKTWVEWCELAFEVGQQNKQAEIDELQKRINDALNEIESGITGKHHVKSIIEILKGAAE